MLGFNAKFHLIWAYGYLLYLVLATVCVRAETPPDKSMQSHISTEYAGKVVELHLGSEIKDTINKKRNVKTQDLSSSATVKSYDPPPEFYRGPGSSSSSTSSSYNAKDSSAAGFISKPITFPSVSDPQGDNLSLDFNKWQSISNGYSGYSGYNGIQDRISVGHYGTPVSTHSTSGHSTGATHSASDAYGYEANPYRHPYTSTHYGVGGAGGVGTTAHYYGHSASAQSGIPFDVYGGKGHYASGGGGEYQYGAYGVDAHEPLAHKGPPEISHKALLAKSFLIPLASAAVLGIAAALVSNPLLLQLGTVSGVGPTIIGKRRRRRGVIEVLGEHTNGHSRKTKLQSPYSGYKHHNANA